jgi:hypothetical protein
MDTLGYVDSHAAAHAVLGLAAERDDAAVGFVVSAIEVMLALRAGRVSEAEALARGFGPDDGVLECRRHGRGWRISLGHRSVTVEQSIGLLHLAVLIANPRQEIPAIDLVAGVSALGDSGSQQEVLDRTAIREYRRRLSQLRTEVDDPERGEQARAERDWLVAALSGASALGDRTRRFADEPERARIAVGKAIRRAIARIAEADAVIGENLRRGVRTGIRCSYWPASLLCWSATLGGIFGGEPADFPDGLPPHPPRHPAGHPPHEDP